MKRKVALGVIVALQFSDTAHAQSTGGFDCGIVPSVESDLEARILAFHSPTETTSEHDGMALYVCRRVEEAQGQGECDLVFSAPLAEFVAAQWIGPQTLAVETEALRSTGQQLELRIVSRSTIPAATMRIGQLRTFAPDAAQQIGERKILGPGNVCQMIPPPNAVRVTPPQESDRMTLDAWLGNGDASAAQVAQLVRKAREGDATSQWQLGVMIDTRQIAGGTLEEAVSLFEASAEHGLSAAIVSLGIMHARGRGTDQDFDAARKAFELAARMGDASAFYQLGVAHYQGHGAPADYQESAAWMMAADELGSEWAQRSLRDDFIDKGVDYERAERRAADILREF